VLKIHGIIVVSVLTLIAGACTHEEHATPLPFVDSVAPVAEAASLSMDSDGVSVDVYGTGGCVTIVEHVPEYGYLEDEFCVSDPTSDPYGKRFTTPACPVSNFGDECPRWLSQSTIGRTVTGASFVCTWKGRTEVKDGWWIAAGGLGADEAFPLDADGVRLDSVSNELDDTMRERCEIVAAPITEARLEIDPGRFDLPITVELDVGVSGTFLLRDGFQPFRYESMLPIGGAPMLVVVYEGTEGSPIGSVAVPEPPECNDPVFHLELSGPSGKWGCG
jgi:hypothetical protein